MTLPETLVVIEDVYKIRLPHYQYFNETTHTEISYIPAFKTNEDNLTKYQCSAVSVFWA